MMIDDSERREVAKALREANFYMSYRSKREMWDELRRIIGEYNDRPFGGVHTFARLADLIEPSSDALQETADENAAEYADAETMRDERDYRYQARVGNVVLQGNNGYALLDAMLEMGA